MGGDSTDLLPLPEGSSLDEDFSQLSSTLLSDRDDGLTTGQPKSYDMRREKVYNEILQSYDELQVRCDGLEEAKRKILSYKPGAWVSQEPSRYDVPSITSLLLIGPRGSGKSGLVNRISRTFEDDKYASERAQVSYNSSVGDGTLFLQEYMILRASSSFCLYDTRSLVEDHNDNVAMLKHLMTRGVRNGMPVIRESDKPSLRDRIKCKARRTGSGPIRKVNFVIFVVDGILVLRSMDYREDADKLYLELIVSAFNCPYLAFLDDKPVVVITHGDLLSRDDRARVRFHLGELLGIPPTKQIFDIPENLDQETELAIMDMLRYSLEHADKNLPRKRQGANGMNKIISRCSSLILLLIMLLGIAAMSPLVLQGNLPRNAQELYGNLHFDSQELDGNLYRDPQEQNVNFQSDKNVPSRPQEELKRNLHPDPQELDEKPNIYPQELNKKPHKDPQELNGNPHRDSPKPHGNLHHNPDTLPQGDVNIEWHKIRHLWLDEDGVNVEWHKIRHLWLDD